jgi:hypothetical protein
MSPFLLMGIKKAGRIVINIIMAIKTVRDISNQVQA